MPHEHTLASLFPFHGTISKSTLAAFPRAAEAKLERFGFVPLDGTLRFSLHHAGSSRQIETDEVRRVEATATRSAAGGPTFVTFPHPLNKARVVVVRLSDGGEDGGEFEAVDGVWIAEEDGQGSGEPTDP